MHYGYIKFLGEIRNKRDFFFSNALVKQRVMIKITVYTFHPNDNVFVRPISFLNHFPKLRFCYCFLSSLKQPLALSST